MPKLSRKINIGHRPDEIYELVSDVARYPDFIKWIHSMKVSNVREENGTKLFRGEATVGFKGFQERFSTDVAANSAARTIRVNLARGPFRHLKNTWDLKEGADGTTVIDFFIDYEFRNPILALLARANTELAVNRIIGAFVEEADRRYGR
ncbi:MAG: type II toxin-antitoxin system RatA family toxin [Henriciella sp.]